MTGVMVEADDAVARDAEVVGDESEALGLADPELAARGVDETKLGAPLPHLLLQGPAWRGPRDAVVLLHVALVVEHAIEPLAGGGPGTGERHEADLGRRAGAWAGESVAGAARG